MLSNTVLFLRRNPSYQSFFSRKQSSCRLKKVVRVAVSAWLNNIRQILFVLNYKKPMSRNTVNARGCALASRWHQSQQNSTSKCFVMTSNKFSDLSMSHRDVAVDSSLVDRSPKQILPTQTSNFCIRFFSSSTSPDIKLALLVTRILRYATDFKPLTKNILIHIPSDTF